MLKRVDLNFHRFNEQVVEEIRSEEQFERDLISSAQIGEAQNQLESLYATAETLKTDLNTILEDSRSTLDNILQKENMQSSDQRQKKGMAFDPSSVRIEPATLSNIDASHRLVDQVIASTSTIIERNKAFLEEFEARYESGQSAMVTKDKKKNKNKGKQRLDEKIVDEIYYGVTALKQNIVEKYVVESTTFDICVLVAIYGGLAFMFFKVNKLVNKAHLF